jgi:hypothetical protein
MNSKNNKIFEQLIEEIAEKTGMSDKDISIKAGRNAGYIAQLRSRIKNNSEQVPEKFIELLRLRFATNLEDPETRYFTVKSEAGKEIGILKEEVISLRSSVAVLEQMMDLVVSNQSGKSIVLVSGERKQATEMEAKRLFAEAKKKYERG